MSSKFSRFLHLERSRGDRPKPEEPSRLQSSSRFEALAERGEALQGAAVPETHLERFRGEAPLAFADAPQGEESFPRCARCESENGRYNQACAVCGADLNTPEQREYHERHRQERQAHERKLAEALEQSRRQIEAQQKEEMAQRIDLMEKLRSDPWGERRGDSFFGAASPGLWLLRRIPSKRVRWGVGVGLVLLPFIVARLVPREGRILAFILGLVLVMLFVPRSWLSWGRSGGR